MLLSLCQIFRVATLLSIASLFVCTTLAEEVHKNIEYAKVGKHRLFVDIYLPPGKARPPLVVWVHGGTWHSGDKENPPHSLVTAGFALASVEYRLSGEAKFPAQVHDIKAAIRFLRSRGNEFGYSTDRIAIAGDSAGGHLAALVGVSGGVEPLEGTSGEHLDQSSAVQAIVDYFGPTNLATILKQSTPHGLNVREPALKLLLGDAPEELPQLAKLASPVSHVDENDPPLLIFHGDQDPQVPINQSHELVGAYERQNLPVEFVVVHGAAHGGEAFFDEANVKRATSFLNQHLTP